MPTLFWVIMAAVLIWAVWKLSRSGSAARDGDSGTYFSDGGSSSSNAGCSDSASDGGAGDGGGGD